MVDLGKIEKWDLIEGGDGQSDKVYDLLGYVWEHWAYADRVSIHLDGNGNMIFRLSTGGWSANEDIISALRANTLFWSLYFWQELKGAHFWFKIPPRRLRRSA